MAPVSELRFHVLVLDPKDRRKIENAIGFGDFETTDPETILYPKDGAVAFFHDLIQGRPLPLTLITSGVDRLSILVVLAVFMSRELAIHPTTPNLLAAADLVDRYQFAGLAHIDRDLAKFFFFVADYLPPTLGQKEQESRLASVISWIRDYILNGGLPALPHDRPMPRVIEVGTDGFVVANTVDWKEMELGWLELYRQGFLRGVLFGMPRDEHHAVLIARKSLFLRFDLRRAAEIFNEAERAMGETPSWVAEELWLRGPQEGTLLLPTLILDVLLRV
jgi:hypothetical protein